MLARGLASGLEQLHGAQRQRAASTAEKSGPAGSLAGGLGRGARDEGQHIVAPAAADPEAIQQRARALIQASIRDKGVPLRDESSG